MLLCTIGIGHTDPLTVPIVYMQVPRPGGNTALSKIPDFFHPIWFEPGTHIMLKYPNTVPEILVDGGVDGAAVDPAVSLDGLQVFYSYCPNVRLVNSQRKNLPRGNCNIYSIDIATHVKVQYTFDEWEPLKDGAVSTVALGQGVFNTAPAPLPNAKVAFTSSRRNLFPSQGYTDVAFQLYVLDYSTTPFITNNITPLALGSALHPYLLRDGSLAYSSFEIGGSREAVKRSWGLWKIYSNGRGWGPLLSAFLGVNGAHFTTQLSSGDIVTTIYYLLNNAGSGSLVQFPFFDNVNPTSSVRFGSNTTVLNPKLQFGFNGATPKYTQWSFSPTGVFARTPVFREDDNNANIINGQYVGKVRDPAALPNNAMLVAYTPGPANSHFAVIPIPTYHFEIRLVVANEIITHPDMLIPVIYEPNYNLIQPRAVVPIVSILGVVPPDTSSNDNSGTQHPLLPKGTPFAFTGTSSLYNRSIDPGKSTAGGVEPFNSFNNFIDSNMYNSGGKVGQWTNADIQGLRVIFIEPTPHKSTYQFPFFSWYNEKYHALITVPVHKIPLVTDLQGNLDTSVLVRIPAETPYTFQTTDVEGRALVQSPTWHQVMAGEIRNDCGGCHAHDKTPLEFSTTVAALPEYIPFDSIGIPLQKVEFLRDIKPLLDTKCITCHNVAQNAGGVRFDDTTLHLNTLMGVYNTLANDPKAVLSARKPPIGSDTTWTFPNGSGFVKYGQSRRSLLTWKMYNSRLDGFLNSTFISGKNNDIDFITNVSCAIATVLTAEEKRAISLWIDTGAPYGQAYLTDSTRPTLVLTPDSGQIIIGMYDIDSGLDMASFSVTWVMPTMPLGVNITNTVVASTDNSYRWYIPRQNGTGVYTVTIKDVYGNTITKSLRQ
jgi:hypothetical protein